MSEILFTRIITAPGAAATSTTAIATYSALIPANTFNVPGILHVHSRQIQIGTNGGGSTNNFKIYLNTTNSLTGAIQIGYMNISSNVGVLYKQGFRNFSMMYNTDLNNGTYYLTGIAFTINSLTEYGATSATIVSGITTFNPFVDNYILISAACTVSGGGPIQGSFLKIIGYETNN